MLAEANKEHALLALAQSLLPAWLYSKQKYHDADDQLLLSKNQ
jgi:hypothetical protein